MGSCLLENLVFKNRSFDEIKIMDLYSINGEKLNTVELKSFKKERDTEL